MLKSIYNSIKASLWNAYNEMTPDFETLVWVPFLISIYVLETWKYIRRFLRPKKSPKPVAATASKPREETALESIERRTRRYVQIEVSHSDTSLAMCHPQDQSPLFDKLPREIRIMIWEFAASQSDDTTHRYSKTAYYYRPGHVARHKTYTEFLLSCRRIWLEANALPLRLAEHSFWFLRGPYDMQGVHGWAANSRRENDRYTSFLDRLTVSNMQNLTHIHLFLQMFQAQEFNYAYWRDHFIPQTYLLAGLRPKLFHITIRQSDWWDWERNATLSLDGVISNYGKDGWVRSILNSPQLGGTKEFRVELETVESKLAELNHIIERLQTLEGKPVSIDPTIKSMELSKFVCTELPRRWSWRRSTNLNGEVWEVFKDLKDLKLHVAVLTWKKKPVTVLSSSSAAPVTPTSRPIDQPPTDPMMAHTQQNVIRSPAMIMDLRAQRAVLQKSPQTRVDKFDLQAAATRSLSDEQANGVEDIRRARFGRMVSDMVAKDIEQRWDREGSLLRFVDPQSMEACHLQWMALSREKSEVGC